MVSRDLAKNTSPWALTMEKNSTRTTVTVHRRSCALWGNTCISSLELERELSFSVSGVESLPYDVLFLSLPFSQLCPSDSPWLEQPEVQLLLQTVINVLLPPRIISTSRSKNFMLESSPAHCSTPGDVGKDLRREGLAESTSQAAYLGGYFPPLPFSLSL